MAKRKEITKKTRFEVFKRDRFTCQYCGRMAPDVVLEVDHIVPVAEGGGNEITNLITSCMECNRGKGKRKLSDDAVIKEQQSQLVELAERREQYEMIAQWRDELLNIEYDAALRAIDYWNKISKSNFTEVNAPKIQELIKTFGIHAVYDAMEIANNTYVRRMGMNRIDAFDKIGGICYNRAKKGDN